MKSILVTLIFVGISSVVLAGPDAAVAKNPGDGAGTLSTTGKSPDGGCDCQKDVSDRFDATKNSLLVNDQGNAASEKGAI